MDKREFLETLIANNNAVIDAKHELWNAEQNRKLFWENNLSIIAESPLFDEYMYLWMDGSLYEVNFDVDDWGTPKIKHLAFEHQIIGAKVA